MNHDQSEDTSIPSEPDKEDLINLPSYTIEVNTLYTTTFLNTLLFHYQKLSDIFNWTSVSIYITDAHGLCRTSQHL